VQARPPFPWGLLGLWLGRYAPAWALMAAVIFIVQTVLAAVLHVREDVVNFLQLLDRMPAIFKAFIGGDDLMPSNVMAIVAIGYQHPLILTMLLINGVTLPTGMLTGEAEQGRMDLLLARPLSRGRVWAVSVAISVLSQAVLVAVVFLGTAVWTRVYDYGQTIPLAPFARVSVNLAALAGCGSALCALAAVGMSERGRAVGLATAYFVASYLLDFSVVWLPQLKVIRPLSLFAYCRPNAVLKQGALPWGPIAVLVLTGCLSLAVSWWIWRRRDLYAA